jgi:chromatin modification-related protein VID21
MPKFTPAELSRMKADKEARDNQEMILAKRRHEELARQNLLRDQAHRMQVQPNLVGVLTFWIPC